MIRNQKQQHQVPLLSILSALISCLSLLLDTLLLNAELAMATSVDSCSASSIKGISCAGKVSISFPFITSDECHFKNSSFLISNCTGPAPEWPAFTSDATVDSPLGSSTKIINMYNPDPGSQINNSVLSPTSGPYGYINLTWSTSLLDQSNGICDKPVSSEQISQYIPHSINLQDFAHSAFNLDPSNIILLFSCNATQANSFPDLTMNSSACTAYAEQCQGQQQCYQYMNPSKELNLSQVMNGSGCKQAMFFVALSSSLPISTWKQGMIRLNWSSIGIDWLAANFKACATCLSKNGSCGYDASSDFQCYCNTSCTASPNSIETGCKGVWCSKFTKIGLGVAITVAITLLIAFTLWGAKRHILFQKRLELDPKCRNQLDLDNLTERPIEMSYSLMVSATNNFVHLLGEGGFGAVYRGSLTDVQIAVKVVQVTSEHRKKHFLNEVSTKGRIHHVHVVRLLGFCVEEHHRILVYEYVNNGSLDKWLFNQGGDPERLLHWRQRYAIAVGIAKGLGYLHEECRHQIVHCDIKPQNILLDEHLCPKIADFGLAKLMARDESAVATLARGTPGYVAPEFWMGGESHLSTKFDVYSYGMVLLELISGHPNFENGSCFPEEAFEAAMKGDIQAIIDIKLGITMPAEDKPMVSTTLEELKHIRRALFVSLWCIQDHPMNRPHMSEVVQYLEGKIMINENPPRPAIASMLVSLSCQQLCQRSHHHHDITSTISGR